MNLLDQRSHSFSVADRRAARRGSAGARPRTIGSTPGSCFPTTRSACGPCRKGDAGFPGRWRAIKTAFASLATGDGNSPRGAHPNPSLPVGFRRRV